MSHAGNPQLHDEFRPAASGRARRSAPRARDGWRDRDARRSAHRPAASCHREARRVQAVQPDDRLHGSARLRLDDVQRARLRARDRESARHRSARARAMDPHDVRRDHADPESPDVDRIERARSRRDGGVPLRVPRARRADGLLRGGLRRAHARDLLPPGRRVPRSARADAAVQGIALAQGRGSEALQCLATGFDARLPRCIHRRLSRRKSTNTRNS